MARARPIPETVTLHVPFRIVKRDGGKEMMLSADGSQQHNTLIKD